MISSTSRILATVALLAGSAVALSACNTVKGMGQDTSAIGHDVTGGASQTQHAVTNNTGLATH